ncbi:MAG: PASTA domain-containing protein [Propionibacteriaceae bacterium]|nr:PASTA domain-containing protein [Propionibacteriaceae bacterium]
MLTATLPDFTGVNLQTAQDQLQGLGLFVLDQEDASGQNRMQLDDSNWTVCRQEPAAGDEVALTDEITLWSVKIGENCDGSGADNLEAATTAPTIEMSSINNGDHQVGADLPGGVYRCDVDTDSLIPYAAVSQTDADGAVTDIRNAATGAIIFTVIDLPGSVVDFQGCSWIGLASENPRQAPITDGYWLVGSEISAGNYTCAVDTAASIPYGAVTQIGADGSVIDIRNGTEGNIIFTVADVAGSVVSFQGCVNVSSG